MNSNINDFWLWFSGFADCLPKNDPPEAALDDLLERLHLIDNRIYFELSINTPTKELILTAQGDVDAFPVVDAIVAAAPERDDWSFIALKPPMGFDFTFRNNGVVLNAADVWFLPLKSQSDPNALGLRLGVPDADAIFGAQTVDAAYTILDTGIGERSTATDIQHVAVRNLPDNPEANGYLKLPELTDYIAFHKTKHTAT